MKIAVMIVGHVRTYKKTHESLFRFFLKNDVDYDIFIESWDIVGNRIGSKKEEQLSKEQVNIEEITKIYRPKVINIEKCFDWLEGNRNEAERVEKEIGITDQKVSILGGHLSQNYKINSCFSSVEKYAKENSVKYDAVVRLRFDIAFLKHFSIKPFKDLLNERVFFDEFRMRITDAQINKISLPRVVKARRHNLLMNDMFNFGSMKTMRAYSSVYPNYVELTKNMLKLTGIHPNEYNIEFVFSYSLISNGIKPEKIFIPIKLIR